MRHRNQRTRFGRQPRHRAATLRMLALGVIKYQRIRTTHVKAKEARKLVEKLITIAKKNTLHARRHAGSLLNDKKTVSRLFKDIAPLFKNRTGGYTRIIPFNFRKGDGASMVFLELTEKLEEKKPEKPKKEKRSEKTKKTEPETRSDRTHKTPAPEVAPDVKEEKTVETVKKEKARQEDKKMERQKGLMKKVKGFFRRKTNM